MMHEQTNILPSKLKSIPLLDNCSDKNFIDSDSDDDDSEDETPFDCDEKIGDTIQSNYDYIQLEEENDELGSTILSVKIKTVFSDCFENRVSLDREEKIGNTIQSNDYRHIKQENDELNPAILPEKTEDIMQSKCGYILIKQENDELSSPILPDITQTEFPDCFESRVSFDCNEKIGDTTQSNYDCIHIKEENDKLGSPILPEKIQTLFPVCFESRTSTPLSNVDKSDVNVKTVFTTPPKRTQTLSVLTVGKKEVCNQRIETISPTHNITEPRIVLKKLKAEVDEILHYEELEISTENTETEENNDDVVNAKDNWDIKVIEDGTMDNVAEIIELENNEDRMEENEITVTEHLEINTDVKEIQTLPILKETKEITIKQEIHEENITLPSFNIDENIKKKNNKKKKNKGKESQKAKHRKCQIM